MSEPASVAPAVVREAVEACIDADGLREACRSLLDACSRRLGVRRAAVITRHVERVDGAAIGFSDAVLEKLKETAMPSAGRASTGDWPLADGPAPALALDPGPAVTCLPFHAPALEFAGAVWVEPTPDDAAEVILRELLDRVTPVLARWAKTDAVREELEQYREEAGHLRRTFDSITDPVVVMGGAGQVRLSNRRADELLMAGPDKSVGRRRAVKTNNLFFSAYRARAILGDDEHRELFLVDPRDGGDLLFEVEVLESRSVGGHDSGTIFILRDITDLKRATAELEAEYNRSVAAQHRSRSESERLNVILANAGIPILVTDERSDIVLMNHDAERLFEGSREHGMETSADIRSNDARMTGLISDFLLQDERRREAEVELREPIGRGDMPARVVLTKIVNRRNEPTAVVCVIHDLSEAREVQRLADELRTLNADLEARVEAATVELSERNRELELQSETVAEANRMKTEFLAMMSHELRTPINSILGFNTLLQEEILGPLTAGQRDTLEKMRSASDHLLSLINDVLDLSQVEAGKLSLQMQEFPISPFVDQLAETIRPMVRTNGLRFDLELAEDLPVVRADPTRLRQVSLNLISNAIKFTEAGRICLRTGLAEDGSVVRLEVEDTGVGIEQEHVDEIFEEFRQIDRFVTRGHGGTGLGLAISRKLIQLMEGSLSVRSTPGEGSVFFVELPAVGAPASRSAMESA